MQDALFRVIEKYREHAEHIRRLWLKDDSFRGLCRDYGDCLSALKYWEQSGDGEAPARREEYAALLIELEEEILQGLERTGAADS